MYLLCTGMISWSSNKQLKITPYLSCAEWKVKALLSLMINDLHFSLQELQLRVSVMWLWLALGPGLLPQQFSPVGGWNPVCLPQEPEGKAPAWTEGKPAELWWEPGENETYEMRRFTALLHRTLACGWQWQCSHKISPVFLRISRPNGWKEIHPSSSAGTYF